MTQIAHDAISGIILAGGKSRRMGRDKAFLELGTKPLIRIVLEAIHTVVHEVFIVTNDPEHYTCFDVRLVEDIYHGLGKLGGIHAGLVAATYDRALVVACDMPCLNPDLLRYLASLSPYYDAVVPRVDGLREPLHAIYSRSCLGAIQAEIDAGRREAYSFHSRVNTRYVEREELQRFDPSLLSLWNVNTPEDWQRAKTEYARRFAGVVSWAQR